MSDNGSVPKYLALRALSEVQPRSVRFLVPGFIPYRTITLVAGVGGLGKSTWLAGVAARVSRGALGAEAESVVLVSFEDTAEEVLRPRIEAAEGDLSRVFEIVLPDQHGINPVCLPGDLDELRVCVREVAARLIIIDPIVAAIDVTFDAHKDQHVRSVLAGLSELAEQEDLAVAMVGHLNKTPSREAHIRIANSVAFWNAARSVVLVTEDADEPDAHRLVAQRKANYSRLAPIERHRLETIVLPESLDAETGRPIETSRMVFVEHASDVDGDDLLAPRERSDRKEDRAGAFLEQALADDEWHDSAGLKKLATTAGVKERTLQLAAQELEVEHDRRGFPSVTWWRLPQSRKVLAHKSCATVQPMESSEFEASSAPSRAVAQENDTTARFGEEMFPVMLAKAVKHGHITHAEAEARYALHQKVNGP
jgi:AAA domain